MPPYKRRSSAVSATSVHEPKASRLSPGPTTPGSIPVIRSPLSSSAVSASPRKDAANARSRSHSTASMTLRLRSTPTPGPSSRRISRQPSTSSAMSQSSSRRMSVASSASSSPSPRDVCEALLDDVTHRYASRRHFVPMKSGLDLLGAEDSDSDYDSDSEVEDFDENRILELAQRETAVAPLLWANAFVWHMGRSVESGTNSLLQLRAQLKRCSKPDQFQAVKNKIEKLARDIAFFAPASDYIADCVSETKSGGAVEDLRRKTPLSNDDIEAVINAIQRLQPSIKQLHEAATKSTKREMAEIHMPFIQILFSQIQNDYILARWTQNRYRRNKRSSTPHRTSQEGVQTLYNRLKTRQALYSVSLAYYGEHLASKGGKAT